MDATAPGEQRILRITRTDDPPGLSLEGELDATRHRVVAQALADLAEVDGELHLDLGGLTFIDLGALRLLAGVGHRRGPRRGLVLDHVAPEVAGVIAIVGWGRLPGLAQGTEGTA
ncbi:STAS domain-containing protein [Streptomyces fractus]|uniref:STAS domain-containing protein n=1 Tax=Streptomyces fractus TaxID=641806 RepID=UPI003CF918BF